MSEEIKKDDLQEEVEATETEETVEKVIEEIPEKSELELANERADEFENKYLRAHAEMQNIQLALVKNVNNFNAIVLRIWQKQSYHRLTI